MQETPRLSTARQIPRRPPSGRSFGSRPRILQVVLSLAPGGTERLVIEIAKRLHPEFPMAVCCLDGPGAWAPELTSAGIDVVSLGRRPGFRPRLGVRLAAVAARHGASVLHCHQYSPFIYGLIAKMIRPSLRVVFTEHGRLSNASPSAKRRVVNRLVASRGDVLTAVSDEMRRYMVQEGFPAARVGVVYNGIDPGPAPGLVDRRAARLMLGLPLDVPVIGTIARFDPVKELTVLMSAFALLRSQARTAKLVLIGDGPELAALQRHAAKLALDDSICFAGLRRDARLLLPAFDLYANSSASEGVSLTLLEAMAACLPVVATAVGGNPEVVVDGQTGVLVPPHAPRALAAAMAHLLGDEERRRILGVAGRARVVREFALDRMVQDYARAYAEGGGDVRCAA